MRHADHKIDLRISEVRHVVYQHGFELEFCFVDGCTFYFDAIGGYPLHAGLECCNSNRDVFAGCSRYLYSQTILFYCPRPIELWRSEDLNSLNLAQRQEYCTGIGLYDHAYAIWI